MSSFDVAIVGSGVAGLTSAYRLAPDHDVVVIDQGPIGGGTSSRASGVITTPVDYYDIPWSWSDHALSVFREFDGTGVFEYTEHDYVQPMTAANEGMAKRKADWEGVELVDAGEAADRFPEVFADTSAYDVAVIYENLGLGTLEVDEFLPTLQREAGRRGVQFRPDTTVESVLVENGETTGVRTEYGPVEADHVVCATGSGTRELLADVIELPIRRFTWNVAILDVGRDLWPEYPMGADDILDVYWRPTREGHLLVGAEHMFVDDDQEPDISEAFEETVGELSGLLADAEDARPVRWEYCKLADSTTPDAHAIIDAPADAPDGLVIAAGFHGTGVMSGDSIGVAVRSLVTGEEAPVPLEPFALDRFDTRSREFEHDSLF